MRAEQLTPNAVRPWTDIIVGVPRSEDARWRNVSAQVISIDRGEVHRLDLRVAHAGAARRLKERQKAAAKKKK